VRQARTKAPHGTRHERSTRCGRVGLLPVRSQEVGDWAIKRSAGRGITWRPPLGASPRGYPGKASRKQRPVRLPILLPHLTARGRHACGKKPSPAEFLTIAEEPCQSSQRQTHPQHPEKEHVLLGVPRSGKWWRLPQRFGATRSCIASEAADLVVRESQVTSGSADIILSVTAGPLCRPAAMFASDRTRRSLCLQLIMKPRGGSGQLK
jgi:hypothetical protein